MVNKKLIMFVQKQLLKEGREPGAIDGIYGEKTEKALSCISLISSAYSRRRKIIAYVQIKANENNIECKPIDGYWGPLTEYAFDQVFKKLEMEIVEPVWRQESTENINPNRWPSQSSDAELIEFYGDPGDSQVMLDLPYAHRLSWNTSKKVSRIQCHQKVHDSLGRVLGNVLASYGEAGIKELRLDLWGGCFNKRKMRGGDRWSMHSWGIAMDYDPNRNKLNWGRNRSKFSLSDYEQWWKCWEDEGWVSLGRARNFDWMHVQAAKL